MAEWEVKLDGVTAVSVEGDAIMDHKVQPKVSAIKIVTPGDRSHWRQEMRGGTCVLRYQGPGGATGGCTITTPPGIEVAYGS